MKKILTLATLIAVVVVSSCSKYDDTEIWNKLDNHENRITAIEELCKQLNANISALQTIVEALEKNDYITAVTPIRKEGEIVGYTITFAHSDTITIYHGENGKDGADGTNGADGKDGYTPQIGVMKDTDGIYYWTIDGEWLLDGKGLKIKAIGTDGADGTDGSNGTDGKDGTNGSDGTDGKDGVTPRLKIENGYWYVSYDEGSSWTELGRATGNDGANGEVVHTPLVGVMKDVDGMYYWTVDGEWLYDDQGTKIKAVGKDGADGIDGSNGTDGKDGTNGSDGTDGKDGVTPRLKIENGYWYVSYDEGSSWTELGKAIGNDGANGRDGDSIFESVTQDEDYVYFNLANGLVITFFKQNVGNIQFEDLQVKTICCMNWDNNNDGELSYIEASAVKRLGTVFKETNILAFTELKYFTGLTSISNSAFYNCVELWKIEIPKNVVTLGTEVFRKCERLNNIVIPEGVTIIPKNTFSSCHKLSNIKLCTTITTIGSSAFSGCPLKEIILPNGLTTIESNAFRSCDSLQSIHIPKSVIAIGSMPFDDGIDTVYMESQTPPYAINDYIFSTATSGVKKPKVYVPTESVAAYRSADGWNATIYGYDFE